LAVLSLQAVAATLSAEEKLLQANVANSELSSEIARLQKLLETKQEAVDALAVSRAARAAGAEAPQFKTVQGNLEFQVRRYPCAVVRFFCTGVCVVLFWGRRALDPRPRNVRAQCAQTLCGSVTIAIRMAPVPYRTLTTTHVSATHDNKHVCGCTRFHF
jgi:hypothetical protein